MNNQSFFILKRNWCSLRKILHQFFNYNVENMCVFLYIFKVAKVFILIQDVNLPGVKTPPPTGYE